MSSPPPTSLSPPPSTSSPIPIRPASPADYRGRSHSPIPITSSNLSNISSNTSSNSNGNAVPGAPSGYRSPPSYARSSLDRSPSLNPMILDDRPRVPPPIYLRSSSPQGNSSKGLLKIHVPAWGVAIVRPPRRRELHPLDDGTAAREPPCEDTVLTGALEVIMKERRRCQAISVGVQSVCRLHMGERGWEEDGVFERGVEVLGGDSEGIWLEKGSQSFTFNILLPATLATHDLHTFGRISYILTARVEGVASSSSLISVFRKDKSPATTGDIPFKEDFDRVIARSDKLAQDIALHRSDSRSSTTPLGLSPQLHGLSLAESPSEDSALALGEGSPSLHGLYHRRQSSDIQRIPSLNLGSSGSGTQSPLADDRRSIHSVRSTTTTNASGERSEKNGWLKGDLCAARALIVHANPNPSGGVTQLDIRKEGYVEGLGTWRFSATSDVFTISAVILLSLSIPAPSPQCTIFFTRLLLVQNYVLISPRRPNDRPKQPETPRNHVLYQVGRPHKSGERFPGHNLDSLWRGILAGGKGNTCGDGEEEGWKTRAVARLPSHDKIRPSTHDGTITPIRVSHEFHLQVFYSVEGQTVTGTPIEGPGELRMMAVKMPVLVPSCCCTTNALNLPTYQCADSEGIPDIDAIISSPPSSKMCMCGSTFAELGEAAMKRLQVVEQEELETQLRERAGSGSGDKGEMERRVSGGL